MTGFSAWSEQDLSEDALLGGRVRLVQPRRGYRVAIDPVLLAAAAPETRGRVLDLGCGVGAVLLCYGHRVAAADLAGLERNPGLAALAARNLMENGWGERGEIHTGDLAAPPSGLVPGSFDLVLTNPPYLEPRRADPSPVALRRAADVENEGFGLADWIGRAMDFCRHKGWLGMVQRADRLDGILAALHGRMAAVTVLPVQAKAWEDAHRVLVFARKGVRTPARVAPALILHEEDGRFTAEAQALLRDGVGLTRLWSA